MRGRVCWSAAVPVVVLLVVTGCASNPDTDSGPGPAFDYAAAVAEIEQGCQSVVEDELGEIGEFSAWKFSGNDEVTHVAVMVVVSYSDEADRRYAASCASPGDFYAARSDRVTLRGIERVDQ